MYLLDEVTLDYNYKQIVGKSNALQYVLFRVGQVAETESNVLILGETGTGKELIARAIHNMSLRKERPLIKIDCATLPVNLIESELFGHEQGSFTDAKTKYLGRFEIAHGSSIFLDEIGELPFDLQAKLLRVIEDREFERLGSSKTIKVDVRMIVATNRDLEKDVQTGHFRQDLLYRINVFPITIPPLRQRIDDIPLLVKSFVNKNNRKMGKKIISIPTKLIKSLQGYDWPGNIRELENVIERSMITTKGSTLKLFEDFQIMDDKNDSNSHPQSLADVERNYILKILKDVEWKIEGKKGAAEVLGLAPSTLRDRLKKLGISRRMHQKGNANSPNPDKLEKTLRF